MSETPCASVELTLGAKNSAEEIIEWCRSSLAHFKCRRTVGLTAIPKTSTGKIWKIQTARKGKGGIGSPVWPQTETAQVAQPQRTQGIRNDGT